MELRRLYALNRSGRAVELHLYADIMATISTQLRNFKEPTKDHLLHLFFSIPEVTVPETSPKNGDKQSAPETEKMEINSVLSLGEHGIEDSYVSLVAAILLSEIKPSVRASRRGNCILSHPIWPLPRWTANQSGSPYPCRLCDALSDSTLGLASMRSACRLGTA